MDAGELIPDERRAGDGRQRGSTRTTPGRGFVLDGFPRTVAQADGLDEILAPVAMDLVLEPRRADRRSCWRGSSQPAGVRGLRRDLLDVASPPKVNWICDFCGGEVVQREDDTEEAIKHRLALYDAADGSAHRPLRRLGQARRGVGRGQPERGRRQPDRRRRRHQHGGRFLPPTPREHV